MTIFFKRANSENAGVRVAGLDCVYLEPTDDNRYAFAPF